MSEQQSLFPLSIDELAMKEERMKIERGLALEKALKSTDVEEIYKANKYLKKIEEREVVNTKSLLVDPLELASSFGYKDKPFNLSYQVLRAMSRTHIVKSIIETRKEQVLTFCKPQKDKYSPGFIVQKKKKYSEIAAGATSKASKGDMRKIEWIVEFLLNCGETSNYWHGDTFDVFVAKITQDSLTFDQGTFEVVRNRGGELVEFFATDASTYRVADSYMDTEEDTKYPEKVVKGYLPHHVQLYQGRVHKEFYPWELSFGIRNPQTDINVNGYGRAELEDMIGTVTNILNADSYNANFFKVGSSPRGILKYSGNTNQNQLEDFRRQWLAQVSGVMNAHKIPMINADKMDFISTHVPNKDMEFSKFHEFLIKIACAMYKIDPSEVGFPMSGNANGTSGLGGNNTEEKVKYSKDKGLTPLLDKIAFWINKFIVNQIDPDYEFRFVGMDDADEQTELDREVLELQNFVTLNEIRKKKDLEPLEFGDMPMNPVYLQAMGMAQQQQQMDQQNQQQQQDQEDDEDPFEADQSFNKSENPFLKSIQSEIEQLIGCE